MKAIPPGWTTSRRALRAGAIAWITLALTSGGDTPVATVQANETCTALPGSGSYCAPDRCGPCFEGEGDCDPGQCDVGLTCVEEGTVDRCRPEDSCGDPGAGDYCASYACGPCGEGEGDCDPGQCAPGLTCVEEGAVDHCRIADDSCDEDGASDFCASSRCGPCGEGEGDCDPGQCAAGLECVEEGSVDRCRPTSSGSGASNFQVKLNGTWRGICCEGGIPQLSDGDCWWTEYDRRLTDEAVGLELYCAEGSPTSCSCRGTGERMHGWNGWNVNASIGSSSGGPVYPDYTTDTCIYVDGNGNLRTKWTDSSCPYFRLE